MYSAGGPLTITFDAQAFPASGGPYFVEVQTNQRGIKVNGQPSSGYTTDIASNQATYWANNGSVSSLTSVEINQASGAYGGMTNQIRVNGKILADSINNNVTWSNSLSGLAGSSLTNPPNGFDGDESSYADSTAGFTLDLSGHTLVTGTHTIEVKSVVLVASLLMVLPHFLAVAAARLCGLVLTQVNSLHLHLAQLVLLFTTSKLMVNTY